MTGGMGPVTLQDRIAELEGYLTAGQVTDPADRIEWGLVEPTLNAHRATLVEMVEEHAAEIMFEVHDGGDPDCTLCKLAVEQGVWAGYGYPDGPWTGEEHE